MTALNKQALREAAEKATALNLDTAQVKRGNDGYLECPCCEGAGYVEEENDFCNIDGVALGVQFYGIGEHHGLAELYLRAANPATMLALLDELEAAEKLATQQGNIAVALLDEVTTLRRNADDKAPDLRAQLIEADNELETLRLRIAELEARTVTLPEEKFCPSEYAGSQYWEETEVWNKAISACAVAIRTAGIGVKGE